MPLSNWNTGAVLTTLRQQTLERREYLMRTFLLGLNEQIYHQTIGEIRGIDYAMSTLDDIEQGK